MTVYLPFHLFPNANLLVHLLAQTAWHMTPPLPWSPLHLAFTLIGIPLATFAAWKLRTLPETIRLHLLFACGFLLAVSEIYKQLFLYYIENGRHFDWWYFPFQLCSLPMYLCLILPFVPRNFRAVLCTFMYHYNLLGAIMVFMDPSGLMHPYWTLTLHGFLWHILLIFIGLLIAFSHMALSSTKGFWQSTAVFAVGCAIATIINIAAHPYGNADMFYITPYYPTTQLVYSQIAATFGILAGNIVYVLSIVCGAWLVHLLYISPTSIKERLRPRHTRS